MAVFEIRERSLVIVRHEADWNYQIEAIMEAGRR